MPSRNRSTPEPATEPSEVPAEDGRTTSAARKGRPTPKRRQAEAANRRPLVQSDRKAASKAQRARARAARDKEYQALQTGDERHMPPRDKGPVRRWIRDYVDARWSLGEFFLPVSLVIVVVSFLFAQNPTASLVVMAVLYLIVLLTIGDAFILSRRLRKKLDARFGDEKVPRGSLMYGVLRSFQMRRTRLPKPKVGRGEFPS